MTIVYKYCDTPEFHSIMFDDFVQFGEFEELIDLFNGYGQAYEYAQKNFDNDRFRSFALNAFLKVKHLRRTVY